MELGVYSKGMSIVKEGNVEYVIYQWIILRKVMDLKLGADYYNADISHLSTFEAQHFFEQGEDVVMDTPDFMTTIPDDPFGEERALPDYPSAVDDWTEGNEYLLLDTAHQMLPPKGARLKKSRCRPRMVFVIPSESDPTQVSVITTRVLSIETRKISTHL